MNKNKFVASVKKNVKENASVIIGLAIGIATTVVVARYQTKDYFKLQPGDLDLMKTEDVNMRFSIRGDEYAMYYLPSNEN